MDFSVLLPTRNRVSQLARALDSMVATAQRPEAIEVVLYVDHDDAQSAAFEFSQVPLVKLVGPRTTMGAMTAACYRRSSGRYIMLANDDIVFRTPGWDRAVKSAFGRFVDDIALVWGNDLCSGAPAHPFLSRRSCDLMGGLHLRAYYREFIDTHLHDVFQQLARLGHQRKVYLHDVVVEHLHVLAGKAHSDAGYLNTRHATDEIAYIERREQRTHQAALLARLIERRLSGAA